MQLDLQSDEFEYILQSSIQMMCFTNLTVLVELTKLTELTELMKLISEKLENLHA